VIIFDVLAMFFVCVFLLSDLDERVLNIFEPSSIVNSDV